MAADQVTQISNLPLSRRELDTRRFLIELQLAGYRVEQKPSSIKLVKGVLSVNPGVLCPTLVKFKHCHKKRKPELLLKHHAVEGLELWSCQGCTEFLLRVEGAIHHFATEQ